MVFTSELQSIMANRLAPPSAAGPLSLDTSSSTINPHLGITDHLPPTVLSVSLAAAINSDILIDVRPYNDYMRGHLQGAVNICIPTTLLKRDSLSLKGVLALASVSAEMKNTILDALTRSKPKLSILIYDQNLHSGAYSYQLAKTIGKFHAHSDVFELQYLEGGFQARVDGGDVAISSAVPNLSVLSCRTKPSLGLAGFELPPSSPCHHSFFQAVKESHDDCDPAPPGEMKFQYPAGFTPPNILRVKLLPTWLRFVADNGNEHIIAELLSKFNKIERLEQTILYTLAAAPQSKSSGIEATHQLAVNLEQNLSSPSCPLPNDIDFSVPEGIEYGHKNRYKNVWPYEHTRVKLEGQKINDDYFNGNHIDCGVPTKATYIATQNPLPSTIDDFWHVVASQNVKFIISLNNLSLAYLEHSNDAPSIKVLFENSDTVVRLVNDKVYHLEFKSWPDFGVPTSFGAIKSLIDAKNYLARNMDSVKVVVHCLAGCGRTGVFIAIDLLLSYYNMHPREFIDTSEDLIYRVVKSQRTQRVSMVQNFAQFVSCYEIILDYLCAPHKDAKDVSDVSEVFE